LLCGFARIRRKHGMKINMHRVMRIGKQKVVRVMRVDRDQGTNKTKNTLYLSVEEEGP
jgi:hypothetical protein